MSVYVCCRQRLQTGRNAKRRGRARSRQQIDDRDVDCGARLALQESSTRHDSKRHDAVTPASSSNNCCRLCKVVNRLPHGAHTRSQHVDNLPANSARSLALSLSLRECKRACLLFEQLLSTGLNNMFERLADNTVCRHTGTLSRPLVCCALSVRFRLCDCTQQCVEHERNTPNQTVDRVLQAVPRAARAVEGNGRCVQEQAHEEAGVR